MKKINKTFLLVLLFTVACLSSRAAVVVQEVRDSISTNTHWTCDKQYLLKGYVYVTSGATLTIDSGVIVKGDKDSKGALIVERGAKLYANGTESAPVVFTSNQALGSRSYGDWGGIILCGNAPVNWASGVAQVEGGPRSLYGGTDPHDNSGSLTYVRIEFGGIAFSANNEVNGLTFCGVGDATTIHHIQVSYSGDDAYEWFGGTVNTKYLVSLANWDDDFDTDNGYSGLNQFGMALRDPFAADQSGSKAWESDSYLAGTFSGKDSVGGVAVPDSDHVTKCVFSNYTVVGPLVSPTSTAWDPQFVAAAHIRRGSAISILNSLLIGYPAGVLLDESSAAYGSTMLNLRTGMMEFKNNAIAGIPVSGAGTAAGPKEVFFVVDGARSRTSLATWAADTITPFGSFGGPFQWLQNSANKVKTYATASTGLRLNSPFNLTNPNFVPTSSSPVCYNNTAGRTFNVNNPINLDTSSSFANYNAPDLIPNSTSTKLSNPFFSTVNQIGAFRYTSASSDNWTRGWCNFDPNNADYSNACNTTSVKQIYDENKLGLRLSPNPAVDATVLGYTLAEQSDVEISVTDMTGRLVSVPFTGTLAPGQYIQKLETDALNSGVYFVNVRSNRTQQTIKLIVSK